MTDTDWERIAVPQADGYDTKAVVALAASRSVVLCNRQRFVDDAGPWFDVAPIYAARLDFQRDFGRFTTASTDHPNILAAVNLIDAWTVGSSQARHIIRVLHPGLDRQVAFDVGWLRLASWCHSYQDAFGTLWATVHSAVGLAEAIVHEMAHHKLRACGVSFNRAEYLVVNPEWHRAPSPLLNGIARPLPAVLHAYYALLHIATLEVAILRNRIRPAAPLVVHLLRTNLGLIQRSDTLLEDRLLLDRWGEAFFRGTPTVAAPPV